MALAFMQAQNQLRTWRGVRGPAGAVVMTLKRLNWTTASWDCWITERGAKLNLHDRTCYAETHRESGRSTTTSTRSATVSRHGRPSWAPTAGASKE
eukprot:8042555-Pyramimonas_sp.AAC.1